MADFLVFAFDPPRIQPPSIAIAANRAGAIGVLNGELGVGEDDLLGMVGTMIEFSRGPFGLALDRLDAERAARLHEFTARGLSWLFLPEKCLHSCPRELLERLRADGLHIVAEMTSTESIREPIAAVIDGVLVKGHEAGGRVGEETSLVLLQHWLRTQALPVYVRGGVGMHNCAGMLVAGASGVALDNQLLLLKESPLRDRLKPLLSSMVGTETALIGDPASGHYIRVLDRPGFSAVRNLRDELTTADDALPAARLLETAGWDDPSKQLMPIGQDAAFAEPWRRRFRTVGGAIQGLHAQIDEHLTQAVAHPVLGAGSPLALSHGTELPIVQGPMTRVSDTAAFAEAVANAGGLPMLALALMRAKAADELLADTARRIGDRPWGVGLLGFAPADLIKAQVEVARKYKPTFAIIAGGRPDQALAMERDGIPSYLHVPSPRLLSLFLEQGAHRFVFEGRECGGHIGPLASTVLWDSMVQALLDEVTQRSVADQIHVIFAGGIHDRRSAAMVAVIAAPLAAKGIKVGILMGTAYLFTHEIVSAGSIVEDFQQQAMLCQRTVALETGTGHASRCADTAFAAEFLDLRKRLQREGRGADEIRDELEDLNLGRLRLASKGVERGGEDGGLREVDVERRRQDGMYMIGQVASLMDQPMTVAELHRQVTTDAQDSVREAATTYLSAQDEQDTGPARPVDIAIVGMGCLLPKAGDVNEYWDNILDKVDAITEIPAHRWDWRLYFDPDRTAEDKIYSKWGGFIDDLAFDPTEFGMPPMAVKAVDPLQLMTLQVVRQTLDDAGYADRDFGREQASIILGASGGADVGCQYAVRAETPRFEEGSLDPAVAERLPNWTEDSFAGILLNVAAGRSANRFDFGGANFTVDSACASSLTAVYLGVAELVDGRSDFVVAGGVDTVQGPFGYLCFSKTQALSPRGRCSTFDKGADGIVISEGIAMIALKRLADAERDGDRIYAVIKGVGASSDGRARSMTAPHPDGQIRALRRAYRTAGYSPATVGLFEAHGTGTVAGDTAELETVTRLLAEHDTRPRNSAIGSVKTLIGHTKASAGIAGLIKSTLALHHRVLPPHANVTDPNQHLADATSPLFLVPDPLPWVRSDRRPRRAGVSAFGFGGTNFHVALEEYRGDFMAPQRPAVRQRLPLELLIWRAPDRAALAAAVGRVAEALEQGAKPKLRDLAYSLLLDLPEQGLTTALVVEPDQNLATAVGGLARHLADPTAALPPRAFFNERPLAADGKTAALFAGQGTQYPNMMRELAVVSPLFKRCLANADELLKARIEESSGEGTRLSRLIYTEGLYNPEQERGAAGALRRTDIAQPAIGAVEAALWQLLKRFGFHADMAGGHSYGEYVALFAAGALNFEDLIQLSETRGRLILDASIDRDLGTMAAVQGERGAVEAIAARYPDLTVANHNAPKQTILSGSREAITAVIKDLEAQEIPARQIPVGAAFHSPFVARARDAFADYLETVQFASPDMPVYSNTTAAPHGTDAEQLRRQLAEHLVSPVEFVREVEAMYADGARLFVGLGPKNVPESLIDQILAGRAHRVIRIDDHDGGLKGLLSALGAMLAEGLPINPAPLFEGRTCRQLPLDDLVNATRAPVQPQHVWILNGSGSHPAGKAPLPPLTLEEVQQRPARQRTQATAPQPAAREPRAFHNSTAEEQMSHPQGSPPAPGTDVVGSAEGFDTAQHYSGQHGDTVIPEFQDTMRQFLRTQESVMLAYLTGARPQQAPIVAQRVFTAPARPTRLLHASATAAGPTATPAVAPVQPVPAPAPTPAQPAVATATPESTPASAPAPPQATQAAGDSGPFGRDQIKDTLLKIAEERTGYPTEMLILDQNMEADLGIDSIKRVEIVGALLKALPNDFAARLEDASGELNTQRTLGGIIDWLSERTGAGSEVANAPFDLAGAEENLGDHAPLPRFIIERHPQPIADTPRNPLSPGTYLLVASPGALADAVTDALTNAGCGVQRLSADACIDGDLLKAHVGKARSAKGGLRGIVHLASTEIVPITVDAELASWRGAAATAHMSLLETLQAAADDLRQGGAVIAATNLGGSFGRDGSDVANGLRPVGGVVGMLKSARQEWPALRCKAVDLDPALDAARNAAILLDELEHDGGRIEVGYPNGERIIFRTVPDPLPSVADSHWPPEQGSVVLAIGGARGITAEILLGFSAPRVRLILVGRSPLPAAEAPELKQARSSEDIRRILMTQLRGAGQPFRPVDVERALRAVLSDREIRANIASLDAAGAEVAYHAVDVRDETAVAALIDAVYDEYGAIDTVLNAAGVIEDKRLEDKTSDSWDRVFGTKVDSTFLLAKHLRPEGLRHFVLFTSVAGRYGNSGQIDYAAANEVMNRVAWQLRQHWQGQVSVKAINWGPWLPTSHGTGMVSAETQRKFESRGVALVPVAAGRDYCIRELLAGLPDAVELVAGGGPWDRHEDEVAVPTAQSAPPAAQTASYPLLWGTERRDAPGGAISIRRQLTPAVDHFLAEHLLDQTPVLPAAAVLELFAEATAAVWPEWQVCEISDLRVLQGIRIERESLAVDIVLRGSSHADASRFEVAAELRSVGDKPRAHYRATVILGNERPAPLSIGKLPRPEKTDITPQDAYRDWLFHGPAFQLLPRFHGIDANAALADVLPSTPKQWLPSVKAASGWIFDPGMIDAAAQMALIWSRVQRDTSALPNRFERVSLYGDGPLPPCRMLFQLLPNLEEHQVRADVAFVDAKGMTRMLIEGLESTASSALVRLGGGWTGEVRV